MPSGVTVMLQTPNSVGHVVDVARHVPPDGVPINCTQPLQPDIYKVASEHTFRMGDPTKSFA
jgi:hypothetical protein